MRSGVRRIYSAGKRYHRESSQSGVALILALIILFVLSALAAGIMSATQTEIWSTANYRTNTQARYIAEAGVQQTVNYLIDKSSAVQTQVALIPTDTTHCIATTVPVTCNSKMVFVQSSSTDPVNNIVAPDPVTHITPSNASTYFTAGTGITDFQSRVGDKATTPVNSSSFGSINSGAGGHYSVVAQLLSVRPDLGSGLAQSWKVISVGSVPTVAGISKVQVVETIEILTQTVTTGGPPVTLSVNGGVQAGSSACGAISLSGGSTLKSYDSSKIATRTLPSSGALNSYGNTIITQGSVNFSNGVIYGNLETTRTGDTYGTGCGDTPASSSAVNVSGNPPSQSVGGVPGIIASGSGWGTPPGGGVYSITTVTGAATSIFGMTTPTVSLANLNTGTCTDPQSGWSGTSRCNGGSDQGGTTNQITMAPNPGSNYGNATIAGSITLTLTQSGVYNFNSLNVTAGGSIVVAPGISVAINITGKQANGTTDLANPLTFDGAGKMTLADDPSKVIFQYAGSGAITYSGSGQMIGVIDAPNANYTFSGAGVVYGAILTKTASFSGSGTVEFDQHLGVAPITVPNGGTPTIKYYARLSQFSWSAF
jgi:Tfp pilus assembly protein PilX